ncbi:MAG: hypothetical protein RL757_2977 [Bacteroidota bacterium]|jgi:ATP-dependent DNA helicase RecG
MITEGKNIDKKSLKFLESKNINWKELAKDCVCFANAQGGFILIGVEDSATEPPLHQLISPEKRNLVEQEIRQRTINVGINVSIFKHENGADVLEIKVLRSEKTIAATTDGRYYVRVGSSCHAVMPDEIARLAAEKDAFVWEIQTTRKVPQIQFDPNKRRKLLDALRKSDRISGFIKEKNDDEILEYYFLQRDGILTNLGILWIGLRKDRALLLYAPAIQIIRYNDREEKIWKLTLDDYECNPQELLYRVMNDVPDWEESVEIADGMFRMNIHYFPLQVIRELVVNALAHRIYTTRGDIFINIYIDRLEIHSPGCLPYGVTPQNILSRSVRRNEHLSKIFYDLGLMEREGSGFDLIYAKLLSSGIPIPIVQEAEDRVTVTIQKRLVAKEIIRLIHQATSLYQLKTKEIITLGLIAQESSRNAMELAKILNQEDEIGLKSWLGKLLEYKIIKSSGKKRGTNYALNPEFVKQVKFSEAKTTLRNIENYTLEALILKDIGAYPKSAFRDIHKRIGLDINTNRVRNTLNKLCTEKKILKDGIKKSTKYSIGNNV